MFEGGCRLFISHSSKDVELAVEFASYLEELGITCWIAPRDIPPGSDWTQAIMQAIDDAEAILILATDSSFSSGQVRRETEKAADRRLNILAALLGSSCPPEWLLYYVPRDHMIHFSRDRVADAALSIMHLLQPHTFSGTSMELSCNSEVGDSPFSGEVRPVFAVRLWLGRKNPLQLQNRILVHAEKLCRGFGGFRPDSALQGDLYLFDSLSTGHTPEITVAFASALQQILLQHRVDEAELKAGIGLSVGRAASNIDWRLLEEMEEAVKEATELSRDCRESVRVSREFSMLCAHVRSFRADESKSESKEGLPETSSVNEETGSVTTVRSRELALLRSRMEELREASNSKGLGGCSHLITGVRGYPGSGKTVLMDTLVHELEGSTEFSVLRSSPLNSKWTHNRLWEAISRELSGREHPIPELISLREWRESLCGLLGRRSMSRFLVAVLEDMDRSDSASLHTLAEVLSSQRFSSPVLFILTYRNAPSGELMNRIADFNPDEIILKPLGSNQVRMMTSLAADLSEEALDELITFCSGNPRFVAEVLKNAEENGMINEIDGVLHFREPLTRLSAAMEDQAFSSLAKLHRSRRDVLRAGALSGSPFQLEDVRRILGDHVDISKTRTDLSALVDAGLLDVVDNSLRRKYSFSGSYLKFAVLSTLPQSEVST